MSERAASWLLRPLRLVLWLVCLGSVCLGWASPVWAAEIPPLSGRVVDTAGVLSAAERGRLEAHLAAYERASGHQFAVLLIDTLEGEPVEQFALRVVESWKLGKAKQDDGALLLLAVRDRKARIEVGYGLEGDIPDAVASRVIRNVLSPRLKQGQYYAGIDAALSALMNAAGGDPGGASPPRSQPAPELRIGIWPILIVFLVLFLLGRGGGGGFGGFLLGSVLSGAARGRRGGFGGYSGGSFGGGGGFSGGGGSFGGGGASGDW